jgi:hypothetical protein
MPEHTESIYEGATGLRLKTRGVWFFFNKDGRIYTIRLDAPFRGAVNGVRIGDPAAKMLDVLGQPVKTLKAPVRLGAPAFLYYLDDETTARFDLDDDNQVETVFLSK